MSTFSGLPSRVDWGLKDLLQDELKVLHLDLGRREDTLVTGLGEFGGEQRLTPSKTGNHPSKNPLPNLYLRSKPQTFPLPCIHHRVGQDDIHLRERRVRSHLTKSVIPRVVWGVFSGMWKCKTDI